MLKNFVLLLASTMLLVPPAFGQGTGTSSSTTNPAPLTDTPSAAAPGTHSQPDSSVTNSIDDNEACKTTTHTNAQRPKTPGSQAEPQPQARCQNTGK